MKTAIAKRTLDNITVVLIAFDGFVRRCFPEEAKHTPQASHIGRPQQAENIVTRSTTRLLPKEDATSTVGPTKLSSRIHSTKSATNIDGPRHESHSPSKRTNTPGHKTLLSTLGVLKAS
eukprot:TRINITY_DN8724_c0_g1_i2.p1 TRINITY_DN8724_c0_g1~~TRINITY_DN8724_c0_g1_i2.p1  ORF type:complete len:119 (-),score=18.16 TRINITY_DN8724_c0_g1_i2:17-373(-)